MPSHRDSSPISKGTEIAFACFDQDQNSFVKNNCRLAIQTITACLLTFIGLMGSTFAADVRKGEILAKRWCASCHVISTEQQQGTAQAPPFSAVANKTDFNETTIAYFLLVPHPRMPDMNLSRSEAADLAAYIKTQK